MAPASRPVRPRPEWERFLDIPGSQPDPRWSARVRQRRSWVGLIVLAALLGSLAVTVWTAQQQPLGRAPVNAAGSAELSTVGGAATDGGQTDRSGPQAPTAVDDGFVTWSVGAPGGGTMYALGMGSCPRTSCPTLLRSADDGGSWSTVHRFPRGDLSHGTGRQVPALQSGNALSAVRFVTPTTGYVFGGDLWVTRDSGATFTQVSHPGQNVLDLQVDRGTVTALTSDNCSDGVCQGPLQVVRLDPGNDRRQAMLAIGVLNQPVSDAHLVVRDGRVLVQPTAGRGRLAPWRLQTDQLVTMRSPRECHGAPLEAVSASGRGRAPLYALCTTGRDDGQVDRRLLRSDDGGANWRVASPETLRMPDVGRVSMVATGNRLVVSTGGPRPAGHTGGTAATLQVSEDAGRTWRGTGKPRPPATGIDQVRLDAGGDVLAVDRTGGPFWRLPAASHTWSSISPRRDGAA